MVGIQSQEKFADDIVNYIISRVVGTHPEDEVINERPSKSFLIGTLAARKERDLEEQVKVDDEGKVASIRASRLKVSVLSTRHELESNPEMTIKTTGNVYYQIKNEKNDASELPTSEDNEKPSSEKDKKHQWKRLNFSHIYKLNLLLNQEFYVDFSQVLETANNDPLILKQIPANLWKAKISARTTDFNEKDLLISFNYENESKEQSQQDKEQDPQDLSKPKDKGKKFDGFERTLFNCKLEIDVGNLPIKEFCDEYLYENYKQRYYYDFRTVNCQVKWVEERKRFVTEHFGRFEQENIRPKESISKLNLIFSNLISSESENYTYTLNNFNPKLVIYDSINERRYSFDNIIKLINKSEEKDIKLVLHFSWPYLKGLAEFLKKIKNYTTNISVIHLGKRFCIESQKNFVKPTPNIIPLSLEGEFWENYYPKRHFFDFKIIFPLPKTNSKNPSVKDIENCDWYFDDRITEIREHLKYESFIKFKDNLLRFPTFIDSFLCPSEIKISTSINNSWTSVSINDFISINENENSPSIRAFKGLCSDLEKYRDLSYEFKGLYTNSAITKKTLFQTFFIEKINNNFKRYVL